MKITPLLALTLAVLTGDLAHAGPVRVDFAGVVDVLETDGEPGAPANGIGSSVQLGTPFSGFFTFDDAAPPLSSTDYQSLYAFAAPLFDLHTTLGEYEFGRTDWYQYGDQQIHEIRVQSSGSEAGQDYGGVAQVNAPMRQLSSLPGGDQVTDFYLVLDGTGSSGPIMSRDIADVPWTIEAFPVHIAGWYFIFVDDESFAHVTRAEGTLTSLIATPVPEPVAATLAALGFAALATRGFLRARS